LFGAVAYGFGQFMRMPLSHPFPAGRLTAASTLSAPRLAVEVAGKCFLQVFDLQLKCSFLTGLEFVKHC